MKRTNGTARMVATGMLLMGAALAVFGDMKSVATNQSYPRVPRTEQEQLAGVRKDDAAVGMVHGLSRVARGRSGETDPCVPVAPVTFSARGAVMC
jgi:hypothetical protein